MNRNEEKIQEAFIMFYKVNHEIKSWRNEELNLQADIRELNIRHLLENLDKALIQVNEDAEGERND